MKKVTAERIAKEIEVDPSERLIEAIIDLKKNRNQSIEEIEELAKKSTDADSFYMTVTNEVLLSGSSYQVLKELNENLKEQLNDFD